MRQGRAMRVRSYRRQGRLVPPTARGLRGRSMCLKPGACMDWHSTQKREELLVMLTGYVHVEAHTAKRQVRRVQLHPGQCAFLPEHVMHRVVNTSHRPARYLYVTAPVS